MQHTGMDILQKIHRLLLSGIKLRFLEYEAPSLVTKPTGLSRIPTTLICA